jgi:endogenous inhibitor of DNA gyrase (YacG/DUF329 family)
VARCPTCDAPLDAPRPGLGPFCSERCQLLDLGAWLTDGARAIPIDDHDEPPADGPPPARG